MTGRHIPGHIIENTHKSVAKTFQAIKDMVDSYYIYDNQQGLALFASNQFHDTKRYEDFIKKGN